VLFGLGTAASAFGTGAARSNGRFDHARTLASELIVSSWPLADGTALVPRQFSSWLSAGHAPLLGEAAIAFQLSRAPWEGAPVVRDGFYVPGVVWLVLGAYFLVGMVSVRWGYRMLKRAVAGNR
jgi:hypothetical protein